jgi:hypothetical protein
MADKLISLSVRAGSTDVSIPVLLRNVANNVETTGVAHSAVTGSYWRQGSTITTITMASLAAIDAAHADGGWREADSTNKPGVYRFDIPDAAFASGADWVVVTAKVANSFIYTTCYSLTTIGTDLTNILARLPAALVSGRIDASVGAMATDVFTATAIASSAVDELSAGLLDDTLAELAQAQPPATPTVAQAIMLLYMAMRNKLIDTPSLLSIHNDAGSVICKATLSEVANTSFTRDKLVAGP